MSQQKLRMNVESLGVASFETEPRYASYAFQAAYIGNRATRILSCDPACPTPSSPPPCTPFPPRF